MDSSNNNAFLNRAMLVVVASVIVLAVGLLVIVNLLRAPTTPAPPVAEAPTEAAPTQPATEVPTEEPTTPPEVAATAPPTEAAPTTSPEEAAPTAAPPEAPVSLVAPPDVVAAFNKGGCGGCHTIPGIPGAVGQVGPDLSNIGVEAATRREGYTAEEYIRESILDPNAFIAPQCPSGPCPPGVMLQSFAQTLSQDELDKIVGYLVKLGTSEAALAAPTPVAITLDTNLPAESVLEPFAPLPKEPAGTLQIALGKHLFFDKRLSGNNSLSCASCHQPDKAFTDGQALSRGYPSTKFFRNTPTVLNTVFAPRLYWDGRMDGSDMPTLVRDHLTEAHFMSMDGRLMAERLRQVPAYVDLFEQAFGGEPTFGRVLNAITAYVQSLNSPPSPYDRYLAGDKTALSEDARAGLELFEGKAGCARCHSGATLSDYQFYNTGVATDPQMLMDPERHLTFRRFFRTLGVPNYRALREDVGQYALTMNKADWGKFRTPSLREVARTAPYMHNGSLATLEDVVRFYNQGGGENQTAGLEPLGLSDTEIAQLVAFLESLNSDLPPVEAPILPDYEILPLGSGVAIAPETAPQPAAEAPAEAPAPSPMALEAFNKGGCGACHVIPGVPGAVGVVGPDLSNIGAVAATRKPDTTAEEYIRESIENPIAFIAPECPTGPCAPGVMPQNLAQTLGPEGVEAIVEYLLSLGGK